MLVNTKWKVTDLRESSSSTSFTERSRFRSSEKQIIAGHTHRGSELKSSKCLVAMLQVYKRVPRHSSHHLHTFSSCKNAMNATLTSYLLRRDGKVSRSPIAPTRVYGASTEIEEDSARAPKAQLSLLEVKSTSKAGTTSTKEACTRSSSHAGALMCVRSSSITGTSR